MASAYMRVYTRRKLKNRKMNNTVIDSSQARDTAGSILPPLPGILRLSYVVVIGDRS